VLQGAIAVKVLRILNHAQNLTLHERFRFEHSQGQLWYETDIAKIPPYPAKVSEEQESQHEEFYFYKPKKLSEAV
jgi:hypothetical protein